MYKQKTGFTLIELLVTATIIIVLSLIGMVSFAKAGKAARDSRRRADLAMVQQAMVQYKVNEAGAYPTGSFATVVGALNTAGYLSDPVPVDPKSPTYDYSCACAAATFSLTATLESGGTFTLSNP